MSKKTIYRCGFYRRVSTDEQARVKEGSLENQLQRLNIFVKHKQELSQHEQWVIVDDYCDDGFSAKDDKRPEYQRLKKDIEVEKINTVLFADLSRISRNVRNFLELTDFFEKHQTDFLCINHPEFSTATPHGTVLLTVFMALMQFEREMTSERGKNARLDRDSRGLWGGNYIYGYDLIPEKHGHLTINKQEAKIVKFIYQQYLKSQSVHKVVQLCKQLNYKTKTYISLDNKKREGTDFSFSSVKSILTNPTYIALKQYKDNGSIKQIETTCWQPIIDKEIFYKTKKIIEANKRSHARHFGKTKKYSFLLGDLIRCSHCQSPLTHSATVKNGMYKPYYAHRKGLRQKTCPLPPNLPAELMDATILDKLSLHLDLHKESDILIREYEKQKTKTPTEIDEKQSEIDEIKNAISAKKKAHGNILNMFSSDKTEIDSETKKYLTTLSGEIEELTTHLQNSKAELKILQDKNSTDYKINKILKDKKRSIANLSPETKQELIQTLVSCIVLNENGIIVDNNRAKSFIGILHKRNGWRRSPWSYMDVEWVDGEFTF